MPGGWVNTVPCMTNASPFLSDKRWPPEKAWDWYRGQPWPCGFNYVPSNAISYTEMWMAYSFDPALIDRELALAQEVGFNCLRVVLPFVVWEAEPERFRQRLDQFLEISHRRGLRVMPALFDDCAFGTITDPVFGQQPDVIPGWYANGWTPSPGHAMVRDPGTWPRLEKYVKDIISDFKNDPRLWVWDLYNEPGNGNLGLVSLPLVEKVFQWAREIDPSQPLTVGRWDETVELNDLTDRLGDIVTFHDYSGPASLEENIAALKSQGRPMICTEWLNRTADSQVAECLPVLRRNGVGAISWGLVLGRTQTHLNWGHRPGDPDPARWQHDLFHPGHTPYDANELAIFRETIAQDRR